MGFKAVEPGLAGTPLNYPNPFRLSAATEIGYRLTTDMDIQIRLYSINGQELAFLNCEAGKPGGQGDYGVAGDSLGISANDDLPGDAEKERGIAGRQ